MLHYGLELFRQSNYELVLNVSTRLCLGANGFSSVQVPVTNSSSF